MRIVSFYPAATEMVVALGLAENLVGVSHACPKLGELSNIPRLTRFCGPENVSAGEIDHAVRQLIDAGEPLYEFDRELFLSLNPDVVLVQSLCHVCAIDENSLARLLSSTNSTVWESSPRTIAEILQGIVSLGDVLGCRGGAVDLADGIQLRMDRVREQVANLEPLRVVFIEWLDPLFAAGHWIPELVQIAGGRDLLGTVGAKSRPIKFSTLGEADPEVIVVGCCGWPAERTSAELSNMLRQGDWQSLQAVRTGRVHVVDAESRFTSPGISIAGAVEELAKLFHLAKKSLSESKYSGIN